MSNNKLPEFDLSNRLYCPICDNRVVPLVGELTISCNGQTIAVEKVKTYSLGRAAIAAGLTLDNIAEAGKTLAAVGQLRDNGAFAGYCELVMRRHDGKKSGWDDVDVGFAIKRIGDELREAIKAQALYQNAESNPDGHWETTNKCCENLATELADIANFAMMAYWQLQTVNPDLPGSAVAALKAKS